MLIRKNSFWTFYAVSLLYFKLILANIRLNEGVLKTSFVFVFRRLDQDEYVQLSLTSSEDVFKTPWRRLVQDQYIRLGHTSSRRLQDVFKTSSGHLQNVLPRRLQDVFKMSSRRLAKTSSRHLQDVLQRYLQDVFKTYHQVKLFLLTRLWEAFNKFLRCSFPKTIIYRGICPGNTTSDKFMVSVQNLQER